MRTKAKKSRIRHILTVKPAMAVQLSADAADLREQIHDEHIWQMAQQENRNEQLSQANEQLVIASVKLQVAAEEIEKSKAEMTHLAHHDFLTKLPNRMQLLDRLAQSIALNRRHHAKLAVLFLDLDRFKLVNDSLGHEVGDQLLQMVAQRLQTTIRSSDTVSRLGGDEFVLLLSEVTHKDALIPKIEHIREVIAAPYHIAGHEINISATIGISLFPQDGEDAKGLMRNADAAMYDAKESGRNRYQFFLPEMRTKIMERQAVEESLLQALIEKEFVLHYQAQVNLETRVITGVEALIRWHHPIRGLLLPRWFIPIAEEAGTITQIGRWVLRQACQQAQSWLDDGLNFDVMAVNISAREFESEGFLDHIRLVLKETGLAPDRLELELTETVLMKSIESAAATFNTLRSMGVRISIDDFGTGYSSLSYLKRFPVDAIKIDQSFIRDMSASDDDVLVKAIIGIGKNLRLQVIAEGVETRQQLDFLRANGCVLAQGFYLQSPMPAEEFEAVLRDGIVIATH